MKSNVYFTSLHFTQEVNVQKKKKKILKFKCPKGPRKREKKYLVFFLRTISFDTHNILNHTSYKDSIQSIQIDSLKKKSITHDILSAIILFENNKCKMFEEKQNFTIHHTQNIDVQAHEQFEVKKKLKFKFIQFDWFYYFFFFVSPESMMCHVGNFILNMCI